MISQALNAYEINMLAINLIPLLQNNQSAIHRSSTNQLRLRPRDQIHPCHTHPHTHPYSFSNPSAYGDLHRFLRERVRALSTERVNFGRWKKIAWGLGEKGNLPKKESLLLHGLKTFLGDIGAIVGQDMEVVLGSVLRHVELTVEK